MKRNRILTALSLEAAVLLLLTWFGGMDEGWVAGSISIPFAAIGDGLRWLSLSGAVGNAVAILLYVGISLLPLAACFWLRRKGWGHRSDGLLILLTVLLFFNLYYMVNPGLMSASWGLESQLSVSILYGGAVYATLFTYGVLRLLFYVRKADRGRLGRCLEGILLVLMAVFVYCAFGYGFQSFLAEVDALRLSNLGNAGALPFTYAFLLLRWLVDALPYLLDVAVALAALELLRSCRKDRYAQEVEERAHGLSRLCVVSLEATVLVTLALDLAQLIFWRDLYRVNMEVLLPVTSVAFVLAALLLAQLLGENRALKQDNDLFI